MRVLLLSTWLLGCLIPCFGQSVETDIGPTKLDFDRLLPKGWSVASITLDAVPYNLALREGERGGVAITLRGPKTVRGPRALNREKESFTLWIMARDYSGTEDGSAPFASASLLGANDRCAVYWACFVTRIPSWPKWQDDVRKHLTLKE